MSTILHLSNFEVASIDIHETADGFTLLDIIGTDGRNVLHAQLSTPEKDPVPVTHTKAEL